MAVSCKKCGGPHPTWDCTATAAKIAAYQASLNPKVIEGAKLVAELPPETQTIMFEGQMIAAGEADGVASRLSVGRTTQGAAASVARPAIKRGRGRPPGPVPFDKKAHDRKMSAKRRDDAKAAKDAK